MGNSPSEASVQVEDILEKSESEIDSSVEGSAEDADAGPGQDQRNLERKFRLYSEIGFIGITAIALILLNG